jgi:hypothetical protein
VQIKLRVTEFELNSSPNRVAHLLLDYENRCQLLSDLEFESGNNRCTYVNGGPCRWKTTVFIPEESQVHAVLSKLCHFINTNYDYRNLSITKGRRSSLFQNPCKVS